MDSELDYYGNLEEEYHEALDDDMAYTINEDPEEMYMSLADLWKYCVKGALKE
ncbi:hypothetical protein BIW11_08757, partial [Tropilaelaps mercedesae]